MAPSREGIGDLSMLFGFELQAEASGISTAINRAAYYYTNLDVLLESAREGLLQTPFLGDMRLPMVSPVDDDVALLDHIRSLRGQ